MSEPLVNVLDRPPDRVTYTEWEAIHGPDRKRQVATDWSLFKVLEYTEVIDQPIVGYRRKRFELWHEPAKAVVVVLSESENHLEFGQERVPPQEIARWEWEYRGAHEQ